jgi:hypothetical protein
MKRFIFVLVVLAVVSPAFAQNNSNEINNIYCVNVLVERIYPSSQGYIVQYLRSTGGVGTVGIPNEWFMDIHSAEDQAMSGTAAVSLQYIAAGKAEIMNLPPGRDWPSMSVFYVDGKFNHIRLYVHRNKSHQTWSNIPQGTDVSRFFSEDRETLNIKF